jgi:hypothetical protein
MVRYRAVAERFATDTISNRSVHMAFAPLVLPVPELRTNDPVGRAAAIAARQTTPSNGGLAGKPMTRP